MKLKLFRIYNKTSSAIVPKKTSDQALKIFSKPRIDKKREREIEALKSTKKTSFKFKDLEIATYHWGNEEKPEILLVHGWESTAGSLGLFANKLSENEHSVMAFDLKAHGKSDGKYTSLIETAEIITELFKKFPSIHTVIGHSMGGSASLLACVEFSQDNNIKNLVTISSPFDVKQIFNNFAKMLGYSDKVQELMIEKITTKHGRSKDDLDFHQFGEKKPEIKKIVVHGLADKVCLPKNALDAAKRWANVQLITREDLAHYKILWDESLVDEILSALKLA